MRKILFGAILLSITLLSCSKDGGGDPEPSLVFLDPTPGHTKTFEIKDSISGSSNTIIQTSSNRDTLVGSRNYHVFDNSDGTREYFSKSGNDYYTLYNLPAGISTQAVELLYLKANGTVGTTWSQNFSFNVPGIPLPIPVKFTHTIKETFLTKTTGSITHNNVIRVETKVSSTLLSINSDIQTYCAPKYGVVFITSYLNETTVGIEISTRRSLLSASF